METEAMVEEGWYIMNIGSSKNSKGIRSTIGIVSQCNIIIVVAEPGFPRRGGCTKPWIWGKNVLFCRIFCRKLQENESNWTGDSWNGVPSAPLDPPMTWYLTFSTLFRLQCISFNLLRLCWAVFYSVYQYDWSLAISGLWETCSETTALNTQQSS